MWLRAVQRLNLALLIYAQHDRFVRGIQIQADDVAYFGSASGPESKARVPDRVASAQEGGWLEIIGQAAVYYSGPCGEELPLTPCRTRCVSWNTACSPYHRTGTVV